MVNLVRIIEGSYITLSEILEICDKIVEREEVSKSIKKDVLKGLEKNKYIVVEFKNLYCYIKEELCDIIYSHLLEGANESLIMFLEENVNFCYDYLGKNLTLKIYDDESRIDIIGFIGIHLFTYNVDNNDVVEKNDFFGRERLANLITGRPVKLYGINY